MTNAAFHCQDCHFDGVDSLVPNLLDQWVVEVAAKRRDGKKRLAQVKIADLCTRHARQYIEGMRKTHHRSPIDPMDTVPLF